MGDKFLWVFPKEGKYVRFNDKPVVDCNPQCGYLSIYVSYSMTLNDISGVPGYTGCVFSPDASTMSSHNDLVVDTGNSKCVYGDYNQFGYIGGRVIYAYSPFTTVSDDSISCDVSASARFPTLPLIAQRGFTLDLYSYFYPIFYDKEDLTPCYPQSVSYTTDSSVTVDANYSGIGTAVISRGQAGEYRITDGGSARILSLDSSSGITPGMHLQHAFSFHVDL